MITDTWHGYFLWAAVCYGGLLMALVGEYRSSTAVSIAGKFFAATAYIAAALSLGAMWTSYGRIMLLGMGLCWLGDLFLVSRQSRMLFLAGLVSFLVGHVAYTVAFAVRGVDVAVVAISLGLMAVFAWRAVAWLYPHINQRMRVPVWLYLAAISVMMVMAAGTHASEHNMFILCSFYWAPYCLYFPTWRLPATVLWTRLLSTGPLVCRFTSRHNSYWPPP